jgi:biofilm PGA synthesis N-glycosyltransferase PgaC
MLRYVVITPARNESHHMRGLIESMVAQSRLPLRWVIVSDASTDGTDEIVESYRHRFGWIELVRMPEKRDRSFAAKVSCFNAGFERVKGLSYDLIASLDADITFQPDYFEYLLERFEENPRLGVGGTPFVEAGAHYDYRFTNIEHVSGACQVFRRECFADIGGYVPIKGGGIDWVAVSTARMKGWQTRTFPERVCEHHRPMGTGSAGRIKSIFRHGWKDYYLGGHPLWQLFRGLYQTTRSPYLIGGLSLLAGYFGAALSGTQRSVSEELMAFHRAEQMTRLRYFFTRSKAAS